MNSEGVLAYKPVGSRDALDEVYKLKSRIQAQTGFLQQDRSFFQTAYVANESLLFYRDGELQGFVTFNNSGYILFLGVDPEWTRFGIASSLLRTSIAQFSVIACHVREPNVAARELYKKFGFHVVDTIPDYYEDGDTGLYLERPDST